MCHKVDGKKCKEVIDKLIRRLDKKKIINPERMAALEKELTIIKEEIRKLK